MGLFETSVEFYRFREPYPPAFFEKVATRLHLTQHTHMLDVGCGPGNLAIGFAPYVGSCTAIDIEPEMLRAARANAAEAKLDIHFHEIPVEEFAAPAGSFHFITIGRALHWLSRQQTLTVCERILTANGKIAICNAAATDSPVNAWTEKFRELRRIWSDGADESKYRPDLDEWFSASRFRRVEEVTAEQRYRFSVDEMVQRGLSFSVTSPAALGSRRAGFEAELRSALDAFAVDGQLEEAVVAKAVIFE
jgi:ubiquinone/menaquinone biosynthesis C-methylase UbiE